MASPKKKTPSAAEDAAKPASSTKIDIPGTLKAIPDQQRLTGLAFLMGEIMLTGGYTLATPQLKPWGFAAVVAWPVITLLVATLLYLHDLSAVRDKLANATISSGVSTAQSPGVAPSKKQFDLFISAPMDALGNDESYRQNQDVILRVMQAFRENTKMASIYFGGALPDSRAEFDDEAQGYEAVYGALQKSQHFVLIWPQKVATSALFEIGVAAQLAIPTVIFHRESADLPYLLRGKLKSGLNDNWSVKEYVYTDLVSLKKIVQLAGTGLFPDRP